MSSQTPAQRQELVAEASAWLDENWSADRSLTEWRQMLLEARWTMPHWPEAFYGRGLDAEATAAVMQVFRDRNIVGTPAIAASSLARDLILQYGTLDQKQRYLKPLLTGEHTWCQLFSEPGSGSDLAGLNTKAEWREGKWVVNGQKVWTTSAHHADFGLLLARTDFDAPKHGGISYFLLPMKQSGIEVRPLRQMNGYASFNEVFITDAVVESEDLLGELGAGWQLARQTLARERQEFAWMSRFAETFADQKGRIYDEYRAEVATLLEPYVWYPQRAGRVDLVLPRARQTGAIEDAVVRQEIARLLCMKRADDIAAARTAESQDRGRQDTALAPSIAKLTSSNIARLASQVHTMISGSNAMFQGKESDCDGLVAEILLSAPAVSIAGGTDEIQKNILAEQVLGMGKEPRSDTGPFRDIKRN